MTWTNPGLVGVGGAPLQVSGTAKLHLELGGQQYLVEMVVADLRTEGVLGLDFLETNQYAIDLPRGIMRLKGNDQLIPLYRTRNTMHQTENVSVVLPNDISIPGCTEIQLGAVIQGVVAGGTMMMERRVIPQKHSAGCFNCGHTKGYNKSTGAHTAIESLPDSVTVHKGTRVA